jgi:hypothetical protein
MLKQSLKDYVIYKNGLTKFHSIYLKASTMYFWILELVSKDFPLTRSLVHLYNYAFVLFGDN